MPGLAILTHQRTTQLLEMDRTMAGIASRFRLAANALSPINQLPPEILCEVFFHLRPVIRRGTERPRSIRRPFGDLLAATHTCQRWRVTAIAAADLWSQLFADSRKNLDDITLLFISRSGELPLDADLGHRLEVVAPYSNRLRTLSCKGCTVDDFSHLTNRPAPLLETLHILPYSDPGSVTLPTLFGNDSPSLRELVVNGYNPLPNNRFRDLSSFHLQLASRRSGRTFLTPLLAMLRDSPRLEELFLRLGVVSDAPLSAHGIPTRVPLHTLQKLHIRGTPATLTHEFLDSVDFAPNGIAVQFTNIADIAPGRNWMPPATLPPGLSLQAATSLEIIYAPDHGLIIQGTNAQARIRVAEASDSNTNHTEAFSGLVRHINPQFPLRELWIHVERRKKYKLPPLSKFNHLEKLVVRVTTDGNPIRRLLQMLDIGRGIPCPFLSTLVLSGALDVSVLSKILKARSNAGCRLGILRLGRTRVLLEEIGRAHV